MCDRPFPGCSNRACSRGPEQVKQTASRHEYPTYARFGEVSAMTSNRTILITGVTGKQGGAVVQALQGTGFHLRGLTRTPNSERAGGVGAGGGGGGAGRGARRGQGSVEGHGRALPSQTYRWNSYALAWIY